MLYAVITYPWIHWIPHWIAEDRSSSIGWGPSTEIYTVADRPAGGRSYPSKTVASMFGFFPPWKARVKSQNCDKLEEEAVRWKKIGLYSPFHSWQIIRELWVVQKLVHMDAADIYNGYSQQVLSIMSVLQKPPVAQDTRVSEQEVLECWIVCHVDAEARPYTLGLCQKLTLHPGHMQLLFGTFGLCSFFDSSFFMEMRIGQIRMPAPADGLFQEAPSHGTDLQGPRHHVVLLLLPESRTESVMLWTPWVCPAHSKDMIFHWGFINFHMSFNAWETVSRQGNQNFHDPFMWTLISSNKNLQSTETLMEHIF